VSVGWRDRDWAKFTPEEFDAIYGGGGSSPFRSGTGGGRKPDLTRQSGSGPRRRRRSGLGGAARIVLASLVGFAAIFGVMLATGHVKSPGAGGAAIQPGLRLNLNPIAPPVVTIPATRPDTKLIRIRWRTTDLAPASYAGRICVTDARHGRICANYVVGERPADTLTRRVEALGLRIESSG
jgi:hypothetical protein